MVIGVHPEETWTYVLECDIEAREKDPTFVPTEFMLGPISARKQARIEDSLTTMTGHGTGKRNSKDDGQEFSVNVGSQTRDILAAGLRGWSDFFFKNGDPIPFKTRDAGGEATDETIGYIPADHRKEIADAITERSEISVEQLGK